MKPTGRKCFALLVLAQLLFAPVPVRGEPEPYKIITAPEVKSMLDAGSAVVIHTLSGIEYEMQHITGSINIPVEEINSTDLLPKDLGKPVIFYCMGTR